MQNKIHILSTRPVGKMLKAAAAKDDIIIDEVSFIETAETIDISKAKKIQELSSQKNTVVFTSMNAVNSVGKYISEKTKWKIFCIGNTTRKIVRDFFGEENIAGIADNANELAEKIIKNPSIKNIVFFCGSQRRDELPEKLKNNGISVEEIIVYKTIETPQTLTRQYDAILFFSPSAVHSFFSKNSIPGKTKLFAIGKTTANSVKKFTQLPVYISDKPGKEDLVNIAIQHFSKSQIF